jgi:hypothetical protein
MSAIDSTIVTLAIPDMMVNNPAIITEAFPVNERSRALHTRRAGTLWNGHSREVQQSTSRVDIRPEYAAAF